jgi:hypothetical protein
MPGDDHLALLVEHDGVAIGVASYEILNGTQAEIVVLVDDSCQGDGIAGDRATDAAALDDDVGHFEHALSLIPAADQLGHARMLLDRCGPGAERVAPLCACPPVPGTPLALEREQAIEERAIASECLPQILGCGLLAI